jgi:hypothetical protein
MDIAPAQRHSIVHLCASITNTTLQPPNSNCSNPAIPTVTPRGPVRGGRGRPKTKTWSNHFLKSTIAAVEAGGRVKTVARYFDILPSSLADHLYGRTLGRKRGPPTILKPDEENALIAYICHMQEYGHLLSMQQLRLKVATIT